MRLYQKQIKNPSYRAVTGIFDPTSAEPATPAFGDEFIAGATGAGNVSAFAFTAGNIYRYDGTTWVEEVPTEGMAADNAADDKLYRFDGSAWMAASTAVMVKELLTVSATNTIADLADAPADAMDVSYSINGQIFDVLAGSGVSLAGQTATIDPAILGFSVESTDRVVATYEVVQ